MTGCFSTSEVKSLNTTHLHTRVSNLPANQQAFLHEQASFRMQIFCSPNTPMDQYGGFLHERLSAYKKIVQCERSLNIFDGLWNKGYVAYIQNRNAILSVKGNGENFPR